MRTPCARRIASCLVVLGVTVGAMAAPRARSATAGDAVHPVAVDVQLTITDSLPARARDALVREAEAIWARAGVQLRWPSTPRPAAADASLRVLVMQRPPDPRRPAGHTWPVGELLRDRSSVPVAIVSVIAARRVVATVASPHHPEALIDHRVGLVLGRAVAHEIGHFLLGTSDHAPSGLMRAHVDVGDFADPRSGGFHLDRAAGEWIRASFFRKAELKLRPTYP